MDHDRSTPEIPGSLVPPDVAEGLRRQMNHLCLRSPKANSFPGAQPVSFARHHIDTLLSRDYFVCEKSDGLRVLMLVLHDGTQQGVFMVTRSQEFYQIHNVFFPKLSDNDFLELHNGTLIDGELVYSNRYDGKGKEIRFLVFDCLTINYKQLVKNDYNKRLGQLDMYFMRPYLKFKEKHPDVVAGYPFKVTMKQLTTSSRIPKVFAQVPNLPHVSDGLIFTCDHAPYVSGTDNTLLKWKPAEENTIDFKLDLHFREYVDEDLPDDDPQRKYLDYDSKPAIDLLAWLGDREYEKFNILTVTETEWEELKLLDEPLNGRIAECRREDGAWRMLRFRDDKANANHMSTVEKVMQSIEDSVTKEELIAAAEQIAHNEEQRRKNRSMNPPPPPVKHQAEVHEEEAKRQKVEKPDNDVPQYEDPDEYELSD
ncbi:hypothetical protein BABINDRAFT_159340 [Babjeviella inositovora NRRL Y-12698]|uniref:mRNA-capping enzyme subunit alpha n=1 Tax=Babjeviella inositovora NRRL Y-12698 TaxID=984486 RepID=A0A1E3QYU8_9ASCO|nr:uncharacterized protein BABINDRAFT_159340 [Babjeviella inositovora NRRL Y-12698]ODQ82843.1 hypothetical protein BABINDRAFT_159340 [Babjeviella inositovora NRRL Y-12698]